jgi:hypothetical protein
MLSTIPENSPPDRENHYLAGYVSVPLAVSNLKKWQWLLVDFYDVPIVKPPFLGNFLCYPCFFNTEG